MTASLRIPIAYRFGGDDNHFAIGLEPGIAIQNRWGWHDSLAPDVPESTHRIPQQRALSLGIGAVLQRERWNVHLSMPAIFLSKLGAAYTTNWLYWNQSHYSFQFGGQYRFQTGNFELSPTVFTVWIPGNGGYILSSWPSFIARTDVVLQARIREKWLAVLGFAQYGAGLGPSAALGAEWGRWRALASVRWLTGLWHSGHVAYQSAHIEAVVSMRLVRQGE